jgi:hypothetical protein
VRAGTPPSAIQLFKRYHRIHGLEKLDSLCTTWEVWFADLEESHTSLGVLAFFRSPNLIVPGSLQLVQYLMRLP